MVYDTPNGLGASYDPGNHCDETCIFEYPLLNLFNNNEKKSKMGRKKRSIAGGKKSRYHIIEQLDPLHALNHLLLYLHLVNIYIILCPTPSYIVCWIHFIIHV